MCTYLLAVSLGNQFTAAVDFFIQNPDGTVKLHGASYFMLLEQMVEETANRIVQQRKLAFETGTVRAPKH